MSKQHRSDSSLPNAKPMSDAHIHAFVDRQLKLEREQRLQELVSAWPEKFEQVQEYQIINQRLVDGLADIYNQPIPQSFINMLSGGSATAASTTSRVTAATSGKDSPSLRDFLHNKMGLSANTKSRPNPSPNKPPTAISIEEKPKKASGTEADHVKDSVDSEQVFEEEIRTLDVDLPQRYGVNFLAGYFSEVLVRTKDLTSAKVRLSASILFGMIIGWAAHNSLNASANSDFSEVAQSAIDAHVFYTADSKHAVEVSVKYKTQLRNWIKKNLESELEPVNLSKFNYALLGGRVLPLKGKLAGQYMYQNNRNKSRLTIYMSNYVQDSNAGKQPHCEKIEGSGNASLSVCGWKKADLIFYVVANLPTSEISQVADRIKKLMPKKKT